MNVRSHKEEVPDFFLGPSWATSFKLRAESTCDLIRLKVLFRPRPSNYSNGRNSIFFASLNDRCENV